MVYLYTHDLHSSISSDNTRSLNMKSAIYLAITSTLDVSALLQFDMKTGNACSHFPLLPLWAVHSVCWSYCSVWRATDPEGTGYIHTMNVAVLHFVSARVWTNRSSTFHSASNLLHISFVVYYVSFFTFPFLLLLSFLFPSVYILIFSLYGSQNSSSVSLYMIILIHVLRF